MRWNAWGSRGTASAVFLLALSVRLIYLYQVSKRPDFLVPIVDSKSYHDAACRLVEEGALDVQFFWQSFFYPLFLAGVYVFDHCSVLAAKLVQTVLGALIPVFVLELGFRIFDKRTAVSAALVAAFYGPLVYFGGELLATTWASIWALLLLLLYLTMERNGRLRDAALFGVAGGLLVLTRAPFLPFFAVSAMWYGVVLRRRRFAPKRLLLSEAAVVAGFLLVVLPVSVMNQRVTGIFSPLPETGWLNLYIGNNSEREEITAIRPGGEWERVLLMPVREGFRSKAEAQRYFAGKVARYVVNEPLHFVKRLGRKTIHFFSSREIPNNADIYANREYSWLYRILVWKVGGFGFPFGVLLPFALIGLAGWWKRIPVVLRLFLVIYPASIVLVFVTARYRAPVIPVLALAAAAGAGLVLDDLKRRRWMRVSAAALTLFLVPVLSSIPGPFAAERVNFEAERKHFVSFHYRDAGDLDTAERLLVEAIELDPSYSEAYQSLGVVYVREGRLEDAKRCFAKALELDPGYYSAYNNMGALLSRQGEYGEALGYFAKALEMNPHSETIYANMGAALVKLGREEEALAYFEKALYYAGEFGNHELARKLRAWLADRARKRRGK